MQGFILGIRRYRDEDLIVRILTPEKLLTLYRFYGARHSVIHLGYKVDFTVETTPGPMIDKLRHVIHLGYPWLFDPGRMLIWQRFLSLLEHHLRDVEIVDGFYFQMLESMAASLERQNPKRSSIEHYLALLEHEGRLHPPRECLTCQNRIGDQVALVQGFVPAHPECVHKVPLPTTALKELIETKESAPLADGIIGELWDTLMEGM